jgi:hypothetical protein
MVDRTKLHRGQIVTLYQAPRPIRPLSDGHVPDVAGAEVEPDSGGSLLKGFVIATLLSVALWLLIALVWRRFA